MLCLTYFIYEELDKSHPTIAVFLNLSKAFDTDDHCIFLKKLEAYRIRAFPLEFIKSNLNKRKQCVNINGTKRENITVKCGVHQGTILGQSLFLMYINDLLNIIPSNFQIKL